MRKWVNRFLLSAVLLAVAATCWASLSGDSLTPQPTQVLVDQTVNGLLSRYHYGDKTLDNTLSAYIFEHYLKDLDPGKFYFTQHDIATFAKFKDKLGDDIRRGNLEPVFEIYQVYQTRVSNQIHFALGLLNEKLSLDTKKTFTFARDKTTWAKDEKALDALWRKRVENDLINLILAGKSRKEAKTLLHKRYKNYLDHSMRVDSADVFDTFMNTYAHAMDPHTAYFSPEQSEQFRINMSLKLQGIGAALTVKNQYISVARVITGGPASKSGKLHAGDRIVGVAQGDDGKMVDVVGWRLSEVVDLIRGKKGTVVRLNILPHGAAPGTSKKELRLVRNVIELKAQQAKSKVLDIQRDGKKHTIGVITIPSFYRDFGAEAEGKKDYRSTTRDVRHLITKLKKKHIHSLVIDLRGNPGGSLIEATELTGLFIGDGPVVQVRASDGGIKVHKSDDNKVAWRGPLVLLVNRFSASAAEIFTAAIQDYHRGVVVGATTYGKGTVQSLVDLNHFVSSDEAGQLKLTIAKFYRVTGSSTQDHGVTPDITIPSAINPKAFGESTQDNAMQWDKIKAATGFKPFSDHVRRDLPLLIKNHDKRIADSNEYQLFLHEVKQRRQRNKKTSVVLDLDERRAQRNDVKADKLSMANQWLTLQDKKPVKTLQDLPDDSDRPDVALNEAAQIAFDMHQRHLGMRNLRPTNTKVAKKVAVEK